MLREDSNNVGFTHHQVARRASNDDCAQYLDK